MGQAQNSNVFASVATYGRTRHGGLPGTRELREKQDVLVLLKCEQVQGARAHQANTGMSHTGATQKGRKSTGDNTGLCYADTTRG